MSKSRPWSNVSAPCRLEWQASRLLAALLSVLGILAGAAAVACQLPWFVSYPLAAAAFLYGILLAWQELRRPSIDLVIPADGRDALIDGETVQGLELQWRGPLVFLRWQSQQGHRRYLLGGPDNLDAAARRELRLAMAARAPVRSPHSVAP